MRMTRIAAISFTTIIIFLVISLVSDNGSAGPLVNDGSISEKPEGTGTAIIMTGAAARITQQAALLEELHSRGLLKDVVFISGVSAGAINAVALNAIIEGKITWKDYREILFGIENNDVFSLPERKKLPLNTEPVRNLLEEFVEDRLGYHKIGDLPVMTEISFTSRHPRLRKDVYRMFSRKINEESDTTLSLVDILMASTAIPIAFPPQRIGNVTTIPDMEYIDGGAGIDYVPFQALLDFQEFRGKDVRRVYIISRKTELASVSQELRVLGIERQGVDRFGNSLDNVMKKFLINRLTAFAKAAPDMVFKSYVWIPDFDQDFLMFNFNNLEEQYAITKLWAQANDPVPLGDYLLFNKISKKDR